MKKGLGYIDLVISIGIFIIYILSIFIFFKPGIQEEYNPDYLNTIVEQNLKEDLYWSVERVPLFIKATDFPLSPDLPADVSTKIQFPFINWEDTNTYLFTTDYIEIPYQFDIDVNPKQINFNLYTQFHQEHTFWLVKTDDIRTSIQITLNPPKVFIPRFGVKETLSGINEYNLTIILANKDYETLKNEWNYPKSKEFQIEIKDATSGTSLAKINEATPSKEAEVSVLRWNDFILETSTKKQQVIISIKTW